MKGLTQVGAQSEARRLGMPKFTAQASVSGVVEEIDDLVGEELDGNRHTGM